MGKDISLAEMKRRMRKFRKAKDRIRLLMFANSKDDRAERYLTNKANKKELTTLDFLIRQLFFFIGERVGELGYYPQERLPKDHEQFQALLDKAKSKAGELKMIHRDIWLYIISNVEKYYSLATETEEPFQLPRRYRILTTIEQIERCMCQRQIWPSHKDVYFYIERGKRYDMPAENEAWEAAQREQFVDTSKSDIFNAIQYLGRISGKESDWLLAPEKTGVKK
jgi:hypothetical protein